MRFRSTLTVTTAFATVLALAGCASGDAQAGGSDDGDQVNVVASTDVYGQIAQEIGGDLIEVTSIITSPSQDPHSFEPSAQDQLAVSNADLVIENGGGYDAFVDGLIESSGSKARVLTAVEFSDDYPGSTGHGDDAAADTEATHDDHDDHADPAADDAAADHDHDHDHIEGFNEHVWYDPHTVGQVADAIAAELSQLLPEDASTFEANAEAFATEVAGLEGWLAGMEAAHAGEQVFATEPVPGYLLAAAGLKNAAPDAFSEAVEEGQDVAPAALLESLGLLEGGGVRVVIANTQTGGAETTRVLDEADAQGIPVVTFSETLPDGQTYVAWMQANMEALSSALGQ